jgi:lactoylglutathione lyase
MKKILALVAILLCGFTHSMAQSPAVKARLNHTAIYVMDLKKSAEFYIGLLGIDTIPEPFHDGKHIWLQTAPGVQMHIIQGATAKKDYYQNQHTCFSIASVEAFTVNLKQKGMGWVDRDGKPNIITNRVDGVKQIWVPDPDGYWVEINDAKD